MQAPGIVQVAGGKRPLSFRPSSPETEMTAPSRRKVAPPRGAEDGIVDEIRAAGLRGLAAWLGLGVLLGTALLAAVVAIASFMDEPRRITASRVESEARIDVDRPAVSRAAVRTVMELPADPVVAAPDPTEPAAPVSAPIPIIHAPLTTIESEKAGTAPAKVDRVVRTEPKPAAAHHERTRSEAVAPARHEPRSATAATPHGKKKGRIIRESPF